MRPPALAEALVAAAAPSRDYEMIAGDLYEEYRRIVSLRGRSAANCWYWTETLRSLPSLLSYCRSDKSAFRAIGVAFTSLAILVTMLVVITAIDIMLQRMFGVGDIPRYISLCVNYGDALLFGAILAALVRNDGPRVAFFASLFLVLCFVVPALAGNPHSQAPPSAWIQLCGAIPAMCVGAAVYQAVKYKIRGAS
jgi:hypothetical protein